MHMEVIPDITLVPDSDFQELQNEPAFIEFGPKLEELQLSGTPAIHRYPPLAGLISPEPLHLLCSFLMPKTSI